MKTSFLVCLVYLLILSSSLFAKENYPSALPMTNVTSNLDFIELNNLDFMGVTSGVYMINFVTDHALVPFSDAMYSVDINVLDGSCPTIDLQIPNDLCNDNGALDLTLYEGLSDPGTWTSDSSNPQMTIVVDGQVDLTGLKPGIYSFIFTLDSTQMGCPELDVITLELSAPPQIISMEDGEVCSNNSGGDITWINLNDLVMADPGVWTDSDGDTIEDPSNIYFIGQAVGSTNLFTYTTTTASMPCEDISTTVTVTVKDCSCNDPEFLDPPVLCNSPGESIDLEDLILSDHVGSWEIISMPEGADPELQGSIFIVEYMIPGDYGLAYSLDEDPGPNCESTFTFVVTINNQQIAEVTPFREVCTTDFNGEQTTVNLDDQLISSFVEGYWINSEGVLVEDPTNLNFLDAEPGDYLFTYVVENEAPCVRGESSVILMANVCNRSLDNTIITVPNIFSPNGDNVNDIFFIQSNAGDLIVSSFTVFDQWGGSVFYQNNFPINDPQYGWDGKSKGQSVLPGVYLYFIEAVNPDGEVIVLVGDVTIIR